MSKYLVIVESPAKVKTLNKFLGEDYVIRPCMGHVVDLPTKSMGIDIDNNFEPHYVVIPRRREILKQLKAEAVNKDVVYLAADPDREGEAISWHLKERLGSDKKFYRVRFNEITERIVKEAFEKAGDFDSNRINAQKARRVLDRIVGYSLSPLLWRKVGRGLSAGRVQSVTVRLIVEREREIAAFTPQEYWEIEAELEKESTVHSQQSTAFIAKLEKIDGRNAEISKKEEADGIVKKLNKAQYIVEDIQTKEKKRNPSAPFITSRLQQEAFNKLRFPVNKTMRIAQQLYEGLELGEEGSVGLITYMRTDSVRVSEEAKKDAKQYISKKYGNKFLPSVPPKYTSRRGAQEAHEAIRPTLPLREPESVKLFLTSEQYKLYELIWNRFISSQMKPAVFSVTTVEITADPPRDADSKTSETSHRTDAYLFKATGQELVFSGFLVLYADEEREEKILPSLAKSEALRLVKLIPSQHFTKPPPKYSDASLVRALEEKGIGRPSTYAPIIHTIVERDYVYRAGGYLAPTELGMLVTDLLTKHFPKILDVEFTAGMEEELDRIEEGKVQWAEVLKSFYDPFVERLSKAQDSIKKEVVPTSEVCALCGRPMVVKWGRWGKFLSCAGFPICKNAKSITTGIKCPAPGCGGELVERRSKRKGLFYGCTKYPQCNHMTKELPQMKP